MVCHLQNIHVIVITILTSKLKLKLKFEKNS